MFERLGFPNSGYGHVIKGESVCENVLLSTYFTLRGRSLVSDTGSRVRHGSWSTAETASGITPSTKWSNEKIIDVRPEVNPDELGGLLINIETR